MKHISSSVWVKGTHEFNKCLFFLSAWTGLALWVHPERATGRGSDPSPCPVRHYVSGPYENARIGASPAGLSPLPNLSCHWVVAKIYRVKDLRPFCSCCVDHNVVQTHHTVWCTHHPITLIIQSVVRRRKLIRVAHLVTTRVNRGQCQHWESLA